jgi:hypothetical protein
MKNKPDNNMKIDKQRKRSDVTEKDKQLNEIAKSI